MFLATRRRLALWYSIVTALLLLLFASGVYLYVRSTLIERIDDTLNHIVEVVRRSLVIEPIDFHREGGLLRINVEASFRNNPGDVEDDHIDLEWFSPQGELLWSTLAEPLNVPLHPDLESETVQISREADRATALKDLIILRQVTQRIQVGRQTLGYLRVSHPWFEVTKPTRQLVVDLVLGTSLMVVAVGAIGWLLSGLAMEPVRNSFQQLKQFTADASHELRNPIATIQTNVQVALSDPEPNLAIQQQQLRVVERLTRRLGRLVDDLLFLARQDSGIVQLKRGPVALDALLQDILEEQSLPASEKQIHLDFAILSCPDCPDAWRILGDRDQLARLFTNLISNAVQYTPTGGSVKVELQRGDRLEDLNQRSVKRPNRIKGPVFQITICDTGVGIPAEVLTRVFDRFYRVDPARSHTSSERQASSTGSGLGLAIARAIVENHQGIILVESEPERGSCFITILPSQDTITKAS